VPRNLCAVLVLLVVAGCSGSTGPAGPAGPALTGAWTGFVSLHDEYGGPLASDSGVTVTASPGSASSVTTSDGAWTLSGLKTGVYTVTFAGSGMGTFIRDAGQFVGGGTIEIATLNLSQQSSGVVTTLALAFNAAQDTLFATGTVNVPAVTGYPRYIRIFYSGSASVGPAVANYTVTGPVAGTAYRVTHTNFSIAITGADLAGLQHAFGSGSTVNAVAYGDSFYNNSYTDTTTGKTVYPNVGPTASNVVQFAMP
jgi:hypothetical protein